MPCRRMCNAGFLRCVCAGEAFNPRTSSRVHRMIAATGTRSCGVNQRERLWHVGRQRMQVCYCNYNLCECNEERAQTSEVK